jgi:hypothetical protein
MFCGFHPVQSLLLDGAVYVCEVTLDAPLLELIATALTVAAPSRLKHGVVELGSQLAPFVAEGLDPSNV